MCPCQPRERGVAYANVVLPKATPPPTSRATFSRPDPPVLLSKSSKVVQAPPHATTKARKMYKGE